MSPLLVELKRREQYLFKKLRNENGTMYLVAILLLFFVSTFVLYYISSYQAQIKLLNSLEFINVRATINILNDIGKI